MLSLYVHIPFCRERCPYCDFFLVTRRDHVDRFFEALAVETAAKAPLMQEATVSAVHFGGGTPSVVPTAFISDWLSLVSGIVRFEADAEITLEANPEDLSISVLDGLQAAGVNRLSLGVQSFTDRKLRALGRFHSSADSVRTVGLAMERFGSVSIDLMCGAQGESLAEWECDLGRSIALRPQHVSVYMLTLEEKTRLWRDVRRGRVELPGEELQAEMYERARQLLTGEGYRHYEVSNFALPGFHSRYNLASWMREPYIGFGPSAHSFLRSGSEERRFANACSLLRYLDDPAGSVETVEVLTPEQRFNEEVFLSLRINRGLPVDFLLKGHPLDREHLDTVLREFRDRGLVDVTAGIVTLTGKGFLFADLIAEELIQG